MKDSKEQSSNFCSSQGVTRYEILLFGNYIQQRHINVCCNNIHLAQSVNLLSEKQKYNNRKNNAELRGLKKEGKHWVLVNLNKVSHIPTKKVIRERNKNLSYVLPMFITESNINQIRLVSFP